MDEQNNNNRPAEFPDDDRTVFASPAAFDDDATRIHAVDTDASPDDNDLTVIGHHHEYHAAATPDGQAATDSNSVDVAAEPLAQHDYGLPASTEKRADDQPPTHRPGRFEVKELLGTGGMATVFRAHDPKLDHDVAIKFLLPRFDDDKEIRERFLNEARTARRLHHANIIVVHDVGEAAGVPYMVMELVDGCSLQQEMRQLRQSGHKMPIRQVLNIGMALARGLDFAWSRHGVVHRDVKPGNVMLNVDGADIKITDFGIAEVRPGAVTSTDTTSGMPGTSSYMSPEQTRGDALDGRSDLFSAGIVLYEALAGVRPFKGENHAQVEDRIRNEQHLALRQWRPDAPASLVRVIERCLQKNPADRFQSGAELLQALSRTQAEFEETEVAGGQRRLPLQWLWALGMGAMVALVLAFTSTWISWKQGNLLDQQVDAYGALLVRALAQQNATAMLSAMKDGEATAADDKASWFAIQTLIEDVHRSIETSSEILLVNSNNLVKVAAADKTLVGKPYARVTTDLVVKPIHVHANSIRYTDASGTAMVGYESKVIVGKLGLDVGRLVIIYPAKAMLDITRTTWILLLVQACATIAGVALASYFWAKQFARPMRALRYAMVELGNGHTGTRLVEKRNDELGLLFDAFNTMATQLQNSDQTRRAIEQHPTHSTSTTTSASASASALP